MIRAVRSDQPSFHNVAFSPGFNIVLADRTKEETKKNTRNGLGKSTLIEIIHFCLGASTRLDSGLLAEPLQGWTFILDLTLGRQEVSVFRKTSDPGRVMIEGDVTGWPVPPKSNPETGALEYSIKEWSAVLGALMFGLPVNEESRNRPTFRGLISYFIRRGRDAYSIPFENYRKQLEGDKQILNAFLLGLEWKDARDLQILKDRKKALEGLQKASKDDVVRQFLGSMGELEAVRVRLAAEVQQAAEQLRTFRVHPQYEAVSVQANLLTEHIHELTNQNVTDGRFLEVYQASVAEEREPAVDSIDRVYAEAGVALPGLVRRRLEDVRTFHHTLVENRRRFLTSEIERLTRAIESRRDTVQQKTQERALLMEVLQTHGALEEYTRLQQAHLQNVAELQNVERRIGDLKTFEEGKSAIAIDQELLLQRGRHDLEERSGYKNQAIRLFNANSQALYRAPGNLVIDIQPTGFRFNVEIERSGSQGIDSMKVFCYDLMLAQLWSQQEVNPGLLVHDSTIFDGVDERQIALALELAERESRRCGFQYICTLNTDAIPSEDFSPGFDLRGFARLTLTDATEDGCLVGIRFGGDANVPARTESRAARSRIGRSVSGAGKQRRSSKASKTPNSTKRGAPSGSESDGDLLFPHSFNS